MPGVSAGVGLEGKGEKGVKEDKGEGGGGGAEGPESLGRVQSSTGSRSFLTP